MTEGQYGTPISPEAAPKKSNTRTIVIIVVLVLLLCCCVSAVVLYFWLGDILLEIWNQMNFQTGGVSLLNLL